MERIAEDCSRSLSEESGEEPSFGLRWRVYHVLSLLSKGLLFLFAPKDPGEE